MTNQDPAETSSTPNDLHSIGGAATASGISPDTLRMWERRYGRPVPVRLPSGHRRYTAEQVAWLRRVAEALALGHRPGSAVAATESELDALLTGGRPESGDGEQVATLIDHVRRFEGDALTRELLAAWRELGPERFLSDRVSPLLNAVGREWADGHLDVRHEHYASELIADLLRTLRAGLPRAAEGPIVVLATLRHELHGLGLQMCALVCSLEGMRPRILGVGTPNEEIAAAAHEVGADAVAISVSLSSGGVANDRMLGDLRAVLSPSIRLVVGGHGARGVRRGRRGIEYLASLAQWREWLHALRSRWAGSAID
ncbi:MerR family transcriptional regulator [Engelhardtia mirabilis]|uniref:B12 binding domain protein n=1 Tax=Engelhardtia mirabilis TaxID=2528011 RepID=A0A518BF53_9BACT|nr:B12 binding domain protein [Planctomycetes bacterium Pla133]QDU99944.1 B12 binding domain protein [Planctomycetes bacterium Pla86]